MEIEEYFDIIGEGNGNPLQYSCLENPMGRGTWWAIVHGVTKSQKWLKQLSTHIYTILYFSTFLLSNLWSFFNDNFVFNDNCCSVAKLCLTLCDFMDFSRLSLPFSPLSPRVCSNSFPLSQCCHSTISSSVDLPSSSLLFSPLSFPASGYFPMNQFFTLGGQSIGVPKYWSSIIPSKEHPGLISFRMDWLDLLAVQGTLKSLLQHHSSKASILWRLAFFTVQLSHPYMTTGKTIASTRQTFVGKVISLLFNIQSRLFTTFLIIF